MITDDTTQDRVEGIVRAVYGADEPVAEWDSLRRIEILLTVEEEFGLIIDETDFATLGNAGALIAHLRARGAVD